MRISTRLLNNATSTYLRLGTTFGLGLFTTWYLVGTIGVVGFGLLALASSGTGVTRALELALRRGLSRDLAAALASGKPRTIRRNVTSAFYLCLQGLVVLVLLVAALASAAWMGLFNTPSSQPRLERALVFLILGEGGYAAARLLGAPYVQALFAAQRVALDNLLIVIGRITYAGSALLVFGWLAPGAELPTQLAWYALSRSTLQVLDVVIGVWLARKLTPGLRLDRKLDKRNYRSVRQTVWQYSQVEILLNLNPQFLAIVINLLFGLTYNGLWQIVIQLSGYARMLSEGLLRGIAPLATHLLHDGRIRAAKDLTVRTIRYQLSCVLPAAIVIGVFSEPILHLWVGRRLEADAYLRTAGISSQQALRLAATMTCLMLGARSLRSAFYGVERILYGWGKVKSFAWMSKWVTVLSLTGGAGLMYLTGSPIGAPLALLLSSAIYSPGVVLSAGRKEFDVPLAAILKRSIMRPIITSSILLGSLLAFRTGEPTMSSIGLLSVMLCAGVFNLALLWFLILEADEKVRLHQIYRSALGLVTGKGERHTP